MIALEVKLNGEKLTLAGAEDMGVLHAKQGTTMATLSLRPKSPRPTM